MAFKVEGLQPMPPGNLSGGEKMPETPQLKMWQGDFGEQYAERNEFADWKLDIGKRVFRRILKDLEFGSVLEVGSNIGMNLWFMNELFKGRIKLGAVEPNRKAFERLTTQTYMQISEAYNCSVFDMPLPDASIDLVFTSGVLIHIGPDDLGRAVDEIFRVARRYILCIEYFSHSPVEVPYRGHQGLLFKRDFGAFYLDRFPNLKWLDYGFLWQREFPIFDNLNWWLFQKTPGC